MALAMRRATLCCREGTELALVAGIKFNGEMGTLLALLKANRSLTYSRVRCENTFGPEGES